MISVELLTAVLGNPAEVKYYGLEYFGYGNKNVRFKWKSTIDGTEVEDSLNTYELMYRCKDWAYKNFNAIIYSAICYDCQSAELHFRGCSFGELQNDEKKYFDYSSERTSVFKACQWILDNK